MEIIPSHSACYPKFVTIFLLFIWLEILIEFQNKILQILLKFNNNKCEKSNGTNVTYNFFYFYTNSIFVIHQIFYITLLKFVDVKGLRGCTNTMQFRLSMFVLSWLGLAVLWLRNEDPVKPCSATPWVSMCFKRIWTNQTRVVRSWSSLSHACKNYWWW